MAGMDRGLNSLLQWGIENSDTSRQANGDVPAHPPTKLDEAALKALMGGPSDADLMRESMAATQNPEISLDNRIQAFDNFEQLIENLDNANNIANLGLWTPLIEQLESAEKDIRRMAAWCCGTAVQNNISSQERLLAVGGLEKLAIGVTKEEDNPTRKKFVYAISSAVRNYQPALDESLRILPRDITGTDKMSCEDMDAIDELMGRLRSGST